MHSPKSDEQCTASAKQDKDKSSSGSSSLQPCRIFVISDIHTDQPGNWEWLLNLSSTEYTHDCLIVAGDVCDELALLQETLRVLASKFSRVFYTPGNHDLWVRKGERSTDSVDKFNAVLFACDQVGVDTCPAKIGACWIVPLFSWYDEDFDPDPTPDPRLQQIWSDYKSCVWPQYASQPSVAQHFLNLNKVWIEQVVADTAKRMVISFSHFLPRRELLPSKENLPFNLFKVSGSLLLDQQVRQLGSGIHCVGHTHITQDRLIDGIRYIQNPLGYPDERAQFPRRIRAPHLPLHIWTEHIALDEPEGASPANGSDCACS